FTRKPRKRQRPSEWALVFDTETTTDACQALRFGAYQIRKGDELIEAGIFYDPEGTTEAEQLMLRDYAAKHELKLMTVTEFIENVFHGVGYDLRATSVGFNLPFRSVKACHPTQFGTRQDHARRVHLSAFLKTLE